MNTSLTEVDGKTDSFTGVHSKRLAVVSPRIKLCPSMDLMVLYGGANQSQLWLHRTVSGQRLNTSTNSTVPEEPEEVTAVPHAAWRPDGRVLATANQRGEIRVQAVEHLLQTTSSSGLDAREEPVEAPLVILTSSSSSTASCSLRVEGMEWAHVGCPHPHWKTTAVEDTTTIATATEIQSPVEFQAKCCLPGTVSQQEPLTLPNADTPLSVLCVVVTEQQAAAAAEPTTSTMRVTRSSTASKRAANPEKKSTLHLVLHGSYPVLKNVPLPILNTVRTEQDNTDPVTLAVSADLVHICCWHSKRLMTIFSLPVLSEQRMAFQTLTALYARTWQQLQILQQAHHEIAASYKSSLKPLDLKLAALVKLLDNYGLLSSRTTLRQLLVQYLLSGHNTHSAPNLSNAIDQFFTSVQMNDQLMNRLERSLTVAVANLEIQARRQLLAPAQAAVSYASQLHGLARSDATLMDHSSAARQLWTCTEVLYQTSHAIVSAVVQARLRLRDWVAWLRATAAQIKARGTKQAPKRRVPQIVTQRLLQYLQKRQEETPESSAGPSETDQVLDLHVLSLLQEDVNCVDIDGKPTPTLPYVLQRTKEAAKVVFDGPQAMLESNLSTTSVVLPDEKEAVVALTTRQGCGDMDPSHIAFGEPEPSGFYCPAADARSFQQWALIAQGTGKRVRLYALPLHWKKEGLATTDTCWMVTLNVSSTVMDVQFYGDDGKSTLSSSSGSGIENTSRQPSLALLLQRPSGVKELCLIPYQDLELRAVDLRKTPDGFIHLPTESPKHVQVENEEGPDSVFGRSRSLRGEATHLQVSGSRGMAAVLGPQAGGTLLELFDLEEDEDEEEEDEEMEDNDGE